MPGTLDLLILKTLSRAALHGYGIAQQIKLNSNNVLEVEEGSLYPASAAGTEGAGGIGMADDTAQSPRALLPAEHYGPETPGGRRGRFRPVGERGAKSVASGDWIGTDDGILAQINPHGPSRRAG
jgi:hypothetical protein